MGDTGISQISSPTSQAIKLSNLIFDMKTKICYVASEFGGSLEDKWEKVLCVFLDKNKANEFKKSQESLCSSISLEEYELLSETIDPSEVDIPKGIIEKYKDEPRYTLEELRKTEELRRREDWDWQGILIEEIELCQ